MTDRYSVPPVFLGHPGQRIRYYRQMQALKQTDLARRANINQGFLSEIERGRRKPSSVSLKGIAEALGVPLHLVAVPSAVFRRHFARPPQFNWHQPYSCHKAVERLGYVPQATPEKMVRETVAHMLEHGLFGDSAQDPFDDRLVALLLRHERELGALLAEKAG